MHTSVPSFWISHFLLQNFSSLIRRYARYRLDPQLLSDPSIVACIGSYPEKGE